MRLTIRKSLLSVLKGFTLIEILIVIIIIGLVGSILTVKIGHHYVTKKRSEFLLKELQSLIKLAKIQAIFNMEVIGLRLEKHQYQFFTYLPPHETAPQGLFVPLADKDPFWASHKIPENIIMRYYLTQPVAAETIHLPQVIISPNGQITPFNLTLQEIGQPRIYKLAVEANGEVNLNAE